MIGKVPFEGDLNSLKRFRHQAPKPAIEYVEIYDIIERHAVSESLVARVVSDSEIASIARQAVIADVFQVPPRGIAVGDYKPAPL